MMKKSISENVPSNSMDSSAGSNKLVRPQNRFTPLKKASNKAGDKIRVIGDGNLKPQPTNISLTGFTWLGPFGAIITAITASICCVVPFILISMGVTGAWLGSLRAFSPYRPVFILLTIGFLAVGFYSVYRKKAVACEPGSLCAVPQTKKAGKIMLWSATFFVAFLTILPYLIGWLA